MVIQREMEWKRAGYVVVFVTLLCALAIASSEGRRKTIAMVLNHAANCHFTSSDLHADMGEQACLKELAEREYEAQEFVPCIQKEKIDKAITILPPERKHDLLDCLRKKSMLSRGSEPRPSLFDWFSKPNEWINGGSNIHIRHLIRASQGSPTPQPAAAQAPSTSSEAPTKSPLPSPSPAPMSSPSHSPAKSPLPNLNPPADTPEPSPASASPPNDNDTNVSDSPPPPPDDTDTDSPPPPPPDDTDTNSPPPPSDDTNTDSPPPPSDDTDVFDSPPSPEKDNSPALPRAPPKRRPPKNQEESGEQEESPTVIIAGIVACGVAVVLVVALFLFCSRSREESRVEPNDGQRDEKPLRNIALGKLSAGSSQKSYNIGNSATKELNADNGNKPPYLVGNLAENPENGTSMAEAPTSDGKSSAMPPLKPPPGRSDSQPPPPPSLEEPAPAPEPAPAAAAEAAAAAAPSLPPPPGQRAPPPPPMKVARPPPAPPGAIPGKSQAAAIGPHRRGPSGSSSDADTGSQKTKLKPFFWDKVLANPGQSMVWHEISAGSFQFNEEMMESLFGYSATETNKGDRKRDSVSDTTQYIQIIDARKAQNLSILLRALNVTTVEVVDAIEEGNPELPAELVQTLLKMAPTTDEELKLRLYSGDLNQLGPAERFLKVLVDIPFAFKRLECLLFMISMAEDVSNIKESFATLEVACNKLRNSRLFLKLLEAVLKTGNRMNVGTYRGGAQAFKLDTLLKLADVKGTDGKTSLLHFVVQEIIRSEGIRAARSEKENRSSSSVISADAIFEDFADDSGEHYRQLGLQVVSGLSTELQDVRRAAAIDADGLATTISKLGQSLSKTKEFINAEMKNLDEDSKFHQSMSKFLEGAEADIPWIAGEEKKIMVLVKSTADYFHGNSGRDEGLRLFTIVRDFLVVLDKTCKQVKEAAEAAAKQAKLAKRETPRSSATSKKNSDLRQRLFPAIAERRIGEDSSSSDDDDGGDSESSSSSS